MAVAVAKAAAEVEVKVVSNISYDRVFDIVVNYRGANEGVFELMFHNIIVDKEGGSTIE